MRIYQTELAKKGMRMAEKDKSGNLMREIRIDKVVLNVGCAGDKDVIERATKLLEMLTEGKKTVVTKSHKRSTFGLTKGRPTGVKLTLRGQAAFDVLKLTFAGVENRIKSSSFNDQGNFNFGVKEYIELPGIKYRHDIGMMGFDVTVSLERRGFSVKKRHVQKRKIHESHKIKKEESIEWVKKNFGVDVVE